MDLKAFRTLKLLEEMEKIPTPSQRDLSKTLNISLGLINSFMKRLVNKGYIKVTTIPKKRAKYILTPKGMAEKTRLTYEFIQYSFEFYKTTRQKLRNLFQVLVRQGVQTIVIYGVGDLAEIAYISLQETPIHMVAVADDIKSGKTFMGFPILNLDELSSILFDKVLITDVDSSANAFKRITASHIPSEKVAMLE